MPVEEADFARLRTDMVVSQIEKRGIVDQAVLAAMRAVPRHRFVLPEYRRYAYDDTPLPIASEQTISQPYVVALMISSLRLQPDDRVLEVGTGSGYAAALLGHIVAEVHTIERHKRLVDYACHVLELLGIDNVHVHHGDGSKGWPPAAPFAGIVVAAGGPVVPSPLKEQLAAGGRLIMPVGRRKSQSLVRVSRFAGDRYHHEELGAVAFVPLIGAEGWE